MPSEEQRKDAEGAVQIDDMRTARDTVYVALQAIDIPEGAEAYWDRAILRGLMNMAAGVWADLFQRVGMDAAVAEFDQDLGILYQAIQEIAGVRLMPEDGAPNAALKWSERSCAKCRVTAERARVLEITFCEACASVLKRKKWIT